MTVTQAHIVFVHPLDANLPGTWLDVDCEGCRK
jgi:hypothetical protein